MYRADELCTGEPSMLNYLDLVFCMQYLYILNGLTRIDSCTRYRRGVGSCLCPHLAVWFDRRRAVCEVVFDYIGACAAQLETCSLRDRPFDLPPSTIIQLPGHNYWPRCMPCKNPHSPLHASHLLSPSHRSPFTPSPSSKPPVVRHGGAGWVAPHF